MFQFCFTKILNQAFLHDLNTFWLWGFFTFLVVLAHGVPPYPNYRQDWVSDIWYDNLMRWFVQACQIFQFWEQNNEVYSLWNHCWESYAKWLLSEGTDTFVISSNRRNLLFSWAWILNLRYFKWLKSCQIWAWVTSEGSNSKLKPYLSLQSHFWHLYDMIWVL